MRMLSFPSRVSRRAGRSGLPFVIGTDVGGTFTDLWIASGDGETRVFKSPTTKDVLGGVIDAMHMAAKAYGLTFEAFCADITRFGHGTTVGLNALLTGTAAKTFVITTKGFGDTLEIGRLRRQTSGMNEFEMTDAFLRNRHPPLAPRSQIIEVDERIDANGKVIAALEDAEADRAVAQLVAQGAQSIAACTLFSVVNPAHELMLRNKIRAALPDAFISLSHEISPSVGEYARMSTTLANAALGPIAGRYLSRLEDILRKAGMKVPVLMMTCAGGVLPTAVLNDRPVFALFSGPAGCVVGSRALGELIGAENVLTTDIGGTSFDVGAIVQGKPIMRGQISIAGADLNVRSIDVDSIGAGGGSIASVEMGDLRVGPKSAGANPGPVCYGRGGTEPTATDADLVLGVLDPDNFIGGQMKLDKDAAARAIEEKIAKPLGLSVMEAAWGIRQILDSRMADLMRRMTLERGYNPRDFVVLANGGAGPSHAWVLSAELGLDSFVVPAAATAQSAYGIATCDLGFVAERPVYVRVGPGAKPAEERLTTVSAALKSAAQEAEGLLREASPQSRITLERRVSIRFRGQTNHMDIALASEAMNMESYGQLVQDFNAQYETLFGRGASFSQAGYEILGIQVAATAHLPPPSIAGAGEPLVKAKTRMVVFDDPAKPVETVIYKTSYPPPGTQADGPCIIEFPGQSVVVPPNYKASADKYGNLHVKRVQA
jgi:N-methylhydantoinase A